MYRVLPEEILSLASDCPFQLYVVGGSVRDFLSGFDECADIDVCAPASAEDFISVAKKNGFTVSAAYKNTGTVKVEKNGKAFEFASFRTDKYVRGEHVPLGTLFTTDMTLDAKRRDFRCNAIYYDIKNKVFIDPLGGIADIKAGVLRTVADPFKVFGEDGLRLMRLARVAAQTGFEPDAECLNGARRNRELISDVSAERIRDELQLILTADTRLNKQYAHYRGLKILQSTGVLPIILPELCRGDGLQQRSDFHSYDVLEHSLRCAMYARADVRLAALLHDVGKPFCLKHFGRYAGHEKWGTDIAYGVCMRLKFPKKVAGEVAALVRTHMFDLCCDMRESKVRRFIVENYELFDKILAVKQADYSACKDDLSESPCVARLKKVYADMRRENVPFTAKELNIKGDELLAAGFPPYRIGKVLFALLLDCASGGMRNERESLLGAAERYRLP